MKKKIREWLLGSTISDLENRVAASERRLQQFINLHDVSIDLDQYSRSDNWAIISVRGKRNYVRMVNLGEGDIRSIESFIQKFERRNITIDHPFFNGRDGF